MFSSCCYSCSCCLLLLIRAAPTTNNELSNGAKFERKGRVTMPEWLPWYFIHPSVPPISPSFFIIIVFVSYSALSGILEESFFRSVFYVLRVRPRKMLIRSISYPFSIRRHSCFPERLEILISTSTLSRILSTHLVLARNYFHLLC